MDPQDIETGAAPDLAGGVSNPDSPPGDGNTNPPDQAAGDSDQGPEQNAGGQPDNGQARGRQPNENRIPYSRVREMIQRAEREAEERVKRQVQPYLERMQQYDPEKLQQGIAQRFLETLYPGAQITKKDPPKYVTEEQMTKLLQEKDQQYRAEMTRNVEIQRAQVAIDDAKRKHADVFEAFPQAEEYIINAWGASGNQTMAQVIEKVVGGIKGLMDKAGTQYVEGKRNDGTVRPLTPGSQARPANQKTHDFSTEDGAEKAALEFLTKGRR